MTDQTKEQKIQSLKEQIDYRREQKNNKLADILAEDLEVDLF